MGRGVQIKLMLVRLTINGLFYYLIFKSYFLFIGLMNQVIDMHFWFLNICWGILGVTYAKVAIDFVRPFVEVPLKMIDLASISLESNSISECTSAVFSKFSGLAIIVTVNKLVHIVLTKVYDSVEVDWLKKIYDKIKNSPIKTVVNMADDILGTVVDNIDECIICSCFIYDESLYESLVFSIKFLWKSLKDIALSVMSLQIFTKFMNLLMFLGYSYYVTRIWTWNINFIVQVFLYYYLIKNIINDVFYKPLIYRVVGGRFVEKSDSLAEDYSEETENILDNIPELDKIKKIMGKNK